MRFTLDCVNATRLPSVIVAVARIATTGIHDAASGRSAIKKILIIKTNAPIFGPTERYPVIGVGEP